MKCLIFILTIMALSSCVSGNHVVSNSIIQKRKYQRGFFLKNISFKKNKQDDATTSTETDVHSSPVSTINNHHEVLATFNKVAEENNIETQLVEGQEPLFIDDVSTSESAIAQRSESGTDINERTEEEVSQKSNLLHFTTFQRPLFYFDAWKITMYAIIGTIALGTGFIIYHYTFAWLVGAMLILLGATGPLYTLISYGLMIFREIESDFHLWGTIGANILWIAIGIAVLIVLTL